MAGAFSDVCHDECSGLSQVDLLRSSPGTVTAKAPADPPAGQGHGDRPRPCEARHVPVNVAGRAASADSRRGQPESAELIQLRAPEGERVEHPDYPLEISAEELKALYRGLVLVRRIDFEAIALQRQGELGIWASLLGQEAAQVGSGRALGPRDMAFPTYREHGVAWCRGLDPTKLLELFRGVSHGGWDPKAHNFHLYTIVIGSPTLHATGSPLGILRAA